jgi:pilus assembly protein CpaF
MVKKIKARVRQRLFSEFAGIFSSEEIDKEELERVVKMIIDDILRGDRDISREEKEEVIKEMVDEFTGFGPIENFLKDPRVTEIMINGPKKIYVEKNGKTEFTSACFDDEQQLMSMVAKILLPTRRRVDESYPYTDVSLPDGSRVNIVIPPLALDGPKVTIRKFLKDLRKIEDLVKAGTLDSRMADFLVACIKAKINIIFSGATGAGKTTTLNVLSSYISNAERIVTIEDTAELRLNQDHVVRLESRQPNIEGKGAISIRDLFHNSLRMRPDRIILGEIRGAEALDLLQAICSGHTGSLAVLHADSPEDVIYRLETMILTSGVPITLGAIHRQIAASVNLIVQQRQMVGGSRKITHIAQINGLKDGQVVVENLFNYIIEGVDGQGNSVGRWISSGITPGFFPKFQQAGVALSADIFKSGEG